MAGCHREGADGPRERSSVEAAPSMMSQELPGARFFETGNASSKVPGMAMYAAMEYRDHSDRRPAKPDLRDLT